MTGQSLASTPSGAPDARSEGGPAERRAAAPLRVAYLASGAAGMYCGSCLRDNRLAATLLAQGRDITLIPLYTPIRTDETDVSEHRVYFGGINVYLDYASGLFRRMPDFIARLLNRPALLRLASRLAGSTRGEDLGGLTVSVLKGEHGPQRREVDRLADALAELKPDVVNLPNLMMIGLAREIRQRTGAAVICTLSGEDIFLDRLVEPFRAQAFDLIAQRAGDCDGYIALTRYYARHAASHYRLPPERVHFVRMGVRVEDFALEAAAADASTADSPDRPLTIGYLARICADEGLGVLCEAVGRLRRGGRAVRVRAAGYLGKADRPYLEQVRASLDAWGLAGAFEYLGEVDRAGKARFLRGCDVFSVPSVFPEAKGLYILEALAAGVPVVQPRQGSFPEFIDDTGGGRLYDAGSMDAYVAALAELIDDAALRRTLAERGRAAVCERYNDAVMAAENWAIYERYRKPTGA